MGSMSGTTENNDKIKIIENSHDKTENISSIESNIESYITQLLENKKEINRLNEELIIEKEKNNKINELKDSFKKKTTQIKEIAKNIKEKESENLKLKNILNEKNGLIDNYRISNEELEEKKINLNKLLTEKKIQLIQYKK